MVVGGWVAVVLSMLGIALVLYTSRVFQQKDKENVPSQAPLSQDIIWSKCGRETFDISRNASL